VIGVMPDGFAQPVPTDVWLPFDVPAAQRTAISGARQLTVYGRIADGQSFEMARSDVNRFTARAIEASPADNKDYHYDIKPLRNVLLSGADSSALFVQAGAATLLVLAILNLASVLIAWGFERKQEMAVRRHSAPAAVRSSGSCSSRASRSSLRVLGWALRSRTWRSGRSSSSTWGRQ
jgi:hypothetical protein